MIAIYVRASSKTQNHRSQAGDLKRWITAYADAHQVRWYRDNASGKSMERPGWQKLWHDVEAGHVSQIVVWRVDRLGRTARGLCTLFDELLARGVNLVSLKDSLDLTTAAGRLTANVLASVAQFETELRSERQRAGIEAARAAGKAWGGRKPGTRVRLTPEKQAAIQRLRASGESISAIARSVELSRPTIYAALAK
jgi:DNA invertase Pin-like site-specific DNA recombinase